MTERIEAIFREPFELGTPEIFFYEPGINIYQIIDRAKYLPLDFKQTGRVFIDGVEIPQFAWATVKPKVGYAVTLHAPIQGGGGDDSGKSIIGLIAAIGLTVLTGGIASGWFATSGGLFAAGSVSANLLAAGVGLVGSLIISAITAPPATTTKGAEQAAQLSASSIEGNVLEANSPIPRVIGTRRIYPPFVSEPIVEMVGQDQIIEAAYILAGPHKLRDIQLGERSVEESATDGDLTVELREGLGGEDPLTFIQRQGKTSDLNVQMSVHSTETENQAQFSGTLPVYHGFNGRLNPDEIWMHFQINGLIKGNEDTAKLRIPLRIRLRRRGDTDWRYLPEFHYQDVTQAQVRFQVKFFFGTALINSPTQPPTDRGFVECRKLVPAQDVVPLGTQFDADSYFSNGAGNDIYDGSTYASTNVKNIDIVNAHTVEVHLDEADWPDGIYDIEVIRGATFRTANFTSATYEYSGDVLDFFGFRSTNTLPLGRDNLLDQLFLVRGCSIWNEYPINVQNTAIIGLKAVNRQVDKLSVKASGYVDDFGGYDYPFAATATQAPNSTWSGATYDKSVPTAFECTIILPEVPVDDAVIWEDGASGLGASLYHSGGFLYLRAGNGNRVETGNNAVVMKMPIGLLPFDGELHKVAWDIRLSPARVRLWIDDVFIGEEYLPNNNPFSGNWAGTAGGAYLRGNAVVAGISGTPVAWDQTLASDLSIFTGDLMDTINQAWKIPTATSNPAPHYRDVSIGTLNFDAMPEELLDDDAIKEWRLHCYRKDYGCDIVAEGMRVQELRNLIASCGFARPYQSELWGIIRDYDRSGENPVQVFSPRNSRDFKWKKAFPRLPTGFRVNYRRADSEDKSEQVIIYRPGSEGNASRLEQVTYEGITRENKVIERGSFDLAQAELRPIIYSFTAPVEAIVCRRGSLIAINHDILLSQYGYGRIVSVTVNGSNNITHIELDSEVDVYSELDMLNLADITNFFSTPDMLIVGLQSAIAIRQTDGEHLIKTLANASGKSAVLEMATPFAVATTTGGPFDPDTIPTVDEGCLVVVGIVGSEYKRYIVSEIQPQDEMVASLVVVDEAPELWS